MINFNKSSVKISEIQPVPSDQPLAYQPHGEEIREITRIHQAETKVVLREVPNTKTTLLKIRSCEFVI